jgi:hypothetical protein
MGPDSLSANVQRNGVETTYIWAGGGFVRILAHLASEHLLRGILCDKLGHGCGVVDVQVRNAQRFVGKGFLAMDTSVKGTCRKALYVQRFFGFFGDVLTMRCVAAVSQRVRGSWLDGGCSLRNSETGASLPMNRRRVRLRTTKGAELAIR